MLQSIITIHFCLLWIGLEEWDTTDENRSINQSNGGWGGWFAVQINSLKSITWHRYGIRKNALKLLPQTFNPPSVCVFSSVLSWVVDSSNFVVFFCFCCPFKFIFTCSLLLCLHLSIFEIISFAFLCSSFIFLFFCNQIDNIRKHRPLLCWCRRRLQEYNIIFSSLVLLLLVLGLCLLLTLLISSSLSPHRRFASTSSSSLRRISLAIKLELVRLYLRSVCVGGRKG